MTKLRWVLNFVYRLIVSHPKKLVLLFFLITFVLGSGLRFTRFSQSYDQFFPKQAVEYQDYQLILNQFGSSIDFLFITIENKKGIFDSAFIRTLRTLTKDIESLDNTESVLSLTNAFNPIISPIGQVYKQYYIRSLNNLKQDSLRIIQEPFLNGFLISNDRKQTAIYINHTSRLPKDSADKYLNQIEKKLAQYENLKANIVGRIIAERDMLKLMNHEFIVSILLLCCILLLLLWILFRNMSLTLAALLIITFPMLWLIGIIGYWGIDTNIITLVLPAVILTIGTSDVVHISLHYINNLRNQYNTKEALRTVISKLGVSTFLTSFTTCLGFLSLNNASLVPIQNLGNHASLGVLFAFTSAFLFFPCILILLPKPTVSNNVRQLINIRKYNYILLRFFIFTIRHRIKIFGSFIILIIVSIVFIFKLHINTYVLEDLSDKHPLKQKFNNVDVNFSGIRSFEMLILLKDSNSSITHIEVLKEIDNVTHFLKNKLGINNIISPSFLAKKVNRAINRGKIEAEILPEDLEVIKPYFLSANAIVNKNISVIDSSQKLGRITGKMGDIGSEKALQLFEQFQQYKNKRNYKHIDLKWTGSAYLVDCNNEMMVKNILMSLMIGILLTFISIWFMTKSFQLSLLAIIVNLIPIVITAGIMGFFDVRIRLVTIVIFSVVFGISIDNLIHFIARYRIEKNTGVKSFYALKTTYLNTGKGIITSSLILIIGFASLLSSKFIGIFEFGLFVSIPMAISVVSVLCILPGAIYKKSSK